MVRATVVGVFNPRPSGCGGLKMISPLHDTHQTHSSHCLFFDNIRQHLAGYFYQAFASGFRKVCYIKLRAFDLFLLFLFVSLTLFLDMFFLFAVGPINHILD